MSEWISVNDSLPGSSDCVDAWASLIGGHGHGDESRIENCFYDHDHDRWWRWSFNTERKAYLDWANVTHWMPIPEPPETVAAAKGEQ